MEMGVHRFQAANLISAIIWVPAIFAPGYFAADSLGSDAEIGELHLFAFVVGIGIITAAGGWATARVLKGTSRPGSKRDGDPDPT
jgi:membrane protein DedA with SNARE-associated domain